MNRRGFLKFLASIPVIRDVKLPAKLYGDGFTGNTTLTPASWKKYSELNLGGGGGGGGAGGHVVFIVGKLEDLKVTANGGKEPS